MKNLKRIFILALCIILSFCFAGCKNQNDHSSKWKKEYDLSSPDLKDAGEGKENANKDGWYLTMIDDFDGDKLSDYWDSPKDYLREKEMYWCDSCAFVEDGLLKIRAEKMENHKCGKTHSKESKTVSTAVDSNYYGGEEGKRLFEQAYGYFEVRCKIPDSDGMWCAFWLQNPNQGRIGDKGIDASEIDIFESSFYKDKTKVGSCIHYDGYAEHHHSIGAVHDVCTDTYEGFHTYAVKWTPEEYVFYFDGKPTWATDAGGVCTTPCFIRFTVQSLPEGEFGPHGQKMGEFTGGDFEIDYIKVYQNESYLDFIKSPDDFKK